MKFKGAFSVFVIFAFIIGAPAVSYIYLTYGLDYRKEALAALQPKSSVQPFQLVVDSSYTLIDDQMQGRVTLVSFVEGKDEDWTYLSALYDQYNARKELQFWTFYELVSPPDSISSTNDWKLFELQRDAYSTWSQTAFAVEVPEYHHMLIDTANSVRNVYNADQRQQLVQLIEHMAIVLPRTAESDIIYEVPEGEK